MQNSLKPLELLENSLAVAHSSWKGRILLRLIQCIFPLHQIFLPIYWPMNSEPHCHHFFHWHYYKYNDSCQIWFLPSLFLFLVRFNDSSHFLGNENVLHLCSAIANFHFSLLGIWSLGWLPLCSQHDGRSLSFSSDFSYSCFRHFLQSSLISLVSKIKRLMFCLSGIMRRQCSVLITWHIFQTFKLLVTT